MSENIIVVQLYMLFTYIIVLPYEKFYYDFEENLKTLQKRFIF